MIYLQGEEIPRYFFKRNPRGLGNAVQGHRCNRLSLVAKMGSVLDGGTCELKSMALLLVRCRPDIISIQTRPALFIALPSCPGQVDCTYCLGPICFSHRILKSNMKRKPPVFRKKKNYFAHPDLVSAPYHLKTCSVAVLQSCCRRAVLHNMICCWPAIALLVFLAATAAAAFN